MRRGKKKKASLTNESVERMLCLGRQAKGAGKFELGQCDFFRVDRAKGAHTRGDEVGVDVLDRGLFVQERLHRAHLEPVHAVPKFETFLGPHNIVEAGNLHLAQHREDCKGHN